MIDRRIFMSGAAASTLAGCVTAPNGQPEINPAFVDAVIAALQAGCGVAINFIPTVESVASVVAALFGPGAVATVQSVTGAVASVAAEICSAIPPAAVASLKVRLAGSSYSAPVYIGTTTTTHTVITGYQHRGGTLSRRKVKAFIEGRRSSPW
jgi:hypothetical protein